MRGYSNAMVCLNGVSIVCSTAQFHDGRFDGKSTRNVYRVILTRQAIGIGSAQQKEIGEGSNGENLRGLNGISPP